MLDYNYFKSYSKMIAKDLNNQQAVDAHPKTIQQISLTGNLYQGEQMFFITEESKENILDFLHRTVRVL